MTQVVNRPVHKIINRGGASIWLPPSCFSCPSISAPDIYAQSSAQLFPLGTKLEFADGRVFRYGKWGATSTAVPMARMVANYNFVPGSAATNGYEGTLDSTSAVAVGTTTLVLNDTTDRAENAYEDGMLAVFPTGHYIEYRIAGNDAATTVDDVTIYLDDRNGLQTLLVVDSTGVTAYPSIFSNLRACSEAYESAMGAVLCDTFTANYFGWVQRKGRCIVTPTAYFGDDAEERMAALHWEDGTLELKASDATHTVGYLTQRTVSGYGDLEVWLTLE